MVYTQTTKFILYLMDISHGSDTSAVYIKPPTEVHHIEVLFTLNITED